MRKTSLVTGLFLMAFLCVQNVGAQSNHNLNSSSIDPDSDLWGFGIIAGTNGIGFEVIKGFGEKLNLRIGTSSLTIPYDKIIKIQEFDLLATTVLNFQSFNGFLDYNLGKFVHLTGGVIKNNMHHTVRITSAGDLPMGTVEVPADEVGYILAEISPQYSVSPYFGLGLGKTLSSDSFFSFNFEIGTFYHGEPQLVLTGDGIIGPIASEENTKIIMDALAPYKWYPLLNIRLGLRLK